jgi:DNA-binding transcriptional LysR family regulator
MTRFTLRQLGYFVTVADTGTISEAAERLHVSQSAVAAAINDLEKSFNAQLCVRRKAHGITLTPTGTALARQARKLLRDTEEMEVSLASSAGELAGPLAVGCYTTLAPTLLPALLDGFGQLHPRVALDFEAGNQELLQDLLFDGELDLALVYNMDLRQGLSTIRLYETRAYVLLPAGHRLAQASTVSLQDMAEDPLIFLDAHPSGRHTLSLFDAQGITPRIRHRTTDFELTRSLVGRGLGYTLLVQRPKNELTYEGLPVVVKEVTPALKPVTVQLIWPESMRLSTRARAFVEYARASLGSPDRA